MTVVVVVTVVVLDVVGVVVALAVGDVVTVVVVVGVVDVVGVVVVVSLVVCDVVWEDVTVLVSVVVVVSDVVCVVVWDDVGEDVGVVVGVVKQCVSSSKLATNVTPSSMFAPQSRATVLLAAPLIKLRILRFGFLSVSIANLVTSGRSSLASSSSNAVGRLAGLRLLPSLNVTMITGAAKCLNPVSLPTTSSLSFSSSNAL